MSVPQSPLPVLIVGAGPTGLVLALSLALRGVRFRIVDDDPGPGLHSRAMVVHARTLEFYRQFGFADEVIGDGVRVEHGRLRASNGTHPGAEVARFAFGDLGAGISPYPFALAYPQDDHERLLVRRLAALGVTVEWNTRLLDFTQDVDGVTARLGGPEGGIETVAAESICGCDGAHSAVRQALGVGFGGGTYQQLYFVADVELAGGYRTDLVINLDKDLFTLLLPVRTSGMQRLIGLVPRELDGVEDLSFENLRARQEAMIDARIANVHWFSTYRVHHRVAERFQQGRAFLAGDAAHLHSPTGGQGMNTGIGDAINLGWKLAMTAQRRAERSLLETYEAERIGFARTLVATTDRAFANVVGGGLTGELMRRIVLPLFFTVGTALPPGRHAIFRLLSQTRIAYEESPLSEPARHGVDGGVRLPYIADLTPDNFAPLASLEWQLHVYGEVSPQIAAACREHGLDLHAFAWTDGARAAHLVRGAGYLIRPDGHVALAVEDPERARDVLQAYRERFGLRLTARDAFTRAGAASSARS